MPTNVSRNLRPTITFKEDEEAFAPKKERWAPKHGWDYVHDVAEAKRMCRDMYAAFMDDESGKRHLFDFALRLRAQGISEKLSVRLISEFSNPLMSIGDVSLTVAHAYDVAAAPPGLMSLAGGPATQDMRWPILEEEEEPSEDAWLDLEPDFNRWPRPLLYDPKQNAAKCAEHFLMERPRRIISSDGQLFSLRGKVWRELSDAELAAEIRATDPDLTLDVDRVMKMVKAIHMVGFMPARPFGWIERPDNAPEPNDLILFRNGMLNLASGELLPHRGQLFATSLPKYDYDAEATCPLWREKLGEWLDSSFHPTLQEFCGYLLTPDTRFEAILAMVGASRGGKGTITRIQEGLVGAEHFASRTLDDLGSSFGLHGTLDKRVILIPDAHDAGLSTRSAALERLKSISGNDLVSVNRKGKDMVTAKVPAKIVLVANKHPKFLDESGALSAREIVLRFESSFIGREDRTLRDRLLAELPGIANWAIEGLERLRNNGRFTIGTAGRIASRELAEAQSPALRYANARLQVTGDAADGEVA